MELWRIPFRHNEWATQEMLKSCRKLSDEQLHRRFEIGLGSLHDTFDHIIGAMARWSDRISGRPVRALPKLGATKFTVDQLVDRLAAAARDLEAAVQGVHEEHRQDEQMDFAMPDGSTIHFTRAAAMVHITTHGVHHRAQAMNMLRHLGVKLEQDFDPVEWELSLATAP
jgi:uncharacterized damage-inducible protein DinB